MAQIEAAGASRLLPSTRSAYERVLAAVRDYLGEASFARESSAGAALPLEAVIEEALALAREVADGEATAAQEPGLDVWTQFMRGWMSP